MWSAAIACESRIPCTAMMRKSRASKYSTRQGEGETKEVDVKPHQLRIDIRAEWAQILAEAWRLQRDFYWAPNYVGVNWAMMKPKYEALLSRIGTRAELNDLIGQMIGELGTSHTYVWGGDDPRRVKPHAGRPAGRGYYIRWPGL